MEKWLVRFLNGLTGWLRRRARSRRPQRPGAGWTIGTVAQGNASNGPELVALAPSQLQRHLYLLGASGSGKSRLLELLIRQHLQRRAGFCLIDPHGDLTRSIFAFLYEEQQRAGEAGAPFPPLYLVEPFQEDGIVGLNPLDPAGGPLYPHIGELVGIFRRFWASSWGPRMEELLRNTLLALALTDPRLTLVEAIPFLTDPQFRARTLGRVADEAIRGYWNHRYDALSDAARMTMAEPALNKLGALLADPRLRCMLGQQEHCLNLRGLMDAGAWLFFNVSKGQLRDAASLLGSFIVAQIQAAAMSRVDLPEPERRPFTLFGPLQRPAARSLACTPGGESGNIACRMSNASAAVPRTTREPLPPFRSPGTGGPHRYPDYSSDRSPPSPVGTLRSGPCSPRNARPPPGTPRRRRARSQHPCLMFYRSTPSLPAFSGSIVAFDPPDSQGSSPSFFGRGRVIADPGAGAPVAAAWGAFPGGGTRRRSPAAVAGLIRAAPVPGPPPGDGGA